MQSRPADERPSRLSLLPLVRDLDEAAAGQPREAPSAPVSQMEWSDEEETSRRSKKKVRERFLNVIDRSKRAAAAAAAAEAMKGAWGKGLPGTAANMEVSSMDSGAISATGGKMPGQASEKRKGGSVRHARAGIEKRRQQEVRPLSPTHSVSTDKVTGLEPASLR